MRDSPPRYAVGGRVRRRRVCFVRGTMLTSEFFTRHPLACAIDLIGCELVWGRCRGVIVETEGYTALGDEACHTFLRRGAQRFVDDHPAGTAYIYLNYGVHWLLNVLIKNRDGRVRADPRRRADAGLPFMRERRKLEDPLKLCSGPGKLTQAFGIPGDVSRLEPLSDDPKPGFPCRYTAAVRQAGEIVCDVRIGISRAADLPWRFLAAGSAYVSRKPTPAASGPLSRAAARARFALGST